MAEDNKEAPRWKQSTGQPPKGELYESLISSVTNIKEMFETQLSQEISALNRAELELARLRAQQRERKDG